jgi:CBS domain-containing protein
MSRPAISASPTTPFRELVTLMADNHIAALPIVDDGHLVGIVTEADLVSKEAYGGHRRRFIEVLADLVAGGETRWELKAKASVASQLMTRDVTCAAPDDDVRAAARLLVEQHRKLLPVVDHGELIGVVSRRNLLALFLRTNDELRRAIEARLAEPDALPPGADIDVSVADGIVHLTGVVTFPSDMLGIEQLVWDVAGVVSVFDDLEPQQDEPRVVPS